MSTEKGDLPDAVAKIYLAEPAKFGGSIAYYAGADAPKPAFRDHGSHLATHETNPNTIRDMVAIAAHRGWTTLDVRGADDFRREVWMEAKARGLDVRGYRSTQRDHQALEQRLEAQANRSIAPAPIERTPAINGANGVEAPTRAAPSRLDYDRGVEGKLVASGQAPYRNKAGEEPTPYIRIEREGGKPLDIWGVTLPEALAKSGAEIGDQVLVRRDGVERVEKTIRRQDEQSGQWTSERREVSRNRWSIEAERFRQSTPAEAARDPDLRNAQSHLAVVETMARAKLKDPASQARVVNRAKERIAEHLADGRQFRPARVQESQKVAEQSGRGRRQTAEAEVAGPERTRQR